MADRRKLQAEMEKVFRKIDEGVDLFDDTMEKIQEANSDNQKEKFQDDLKKEIKKLQRLRDQIKVWQNSSEVREKEKLEELKKKIEEKMQQFKSIERVNKTKPHSKIGLNTQEKIDPKEQEKNETRDWLQHCITDLNDHCDIFESEIEKLGSAGTRKKKGKEDKDRASQIEIHQDNLEKHKYHIAKLELIMRLVDNDSLEVDDVNAVKENIIDYIERYDDADFVPDDELYEDLLGDTTEINQQLGNVTNIGTLDDAENTSEPSHSPAPSPSPVPKEPEPSDQKMRHSSGNAELGWTRSNLRSSINHGGSRSAHVTPLKLSEQTSMETAVSSPPPIATPPLPPGIPYNSIAAGNRGLNSSTANSSPTKELSAGPSRSSSSGPSAVQNIQFSSSGPALSDMAPSPLLGASQTTEIGGLLAASLSESAEASALITANKMLTNQSVNIGAAVERRAPSPAIAPPAAAMPSAVPPRINLPSQDSEMAVESKAMVNGEHGVPSLSNIAQHAISLEEGNGAISANDLTMFQLQQRQAQLEGMQAYMNDFLRSNSSAGGQQEAQEAKIPPSLGASPLGCSNPNPEHEIKLQLLEASNNKIPHSMDSEKLKLYLKRNPCQCPSYYPQTPPPLAETLEYWNRLTPETLFFVFYYMEGTKAQYLAARALKKQAWRFHKKYLMWFQRHEEPKTITDDYEQGTYVYFDFEKWAQRKKENFTFEYRYLEDRELA